LIWISYFGGKILLNFIESILEIECEDIGNNTIQEIESREHLSLHSDTDIIWKKYYTFERCREKKILPNSEDKKELIEIIQETYKGTIPKELKT
jgi:hypothetical protein